MRAALPVLLALACACAAETPLPEELADVEIVFEGAAEFSRSTMYRVIRPDLERYARTGHASSLDDAAFRLANRYRTEGYAHVEVSVAREAGMIVFRVHEGPQIFPGRIHFRNNTALSSDELREAMPRALPGTTTPFSERLLALQLEAIVSAYHRRGYLEASVDEPSRRYDEKRRSMHVTFFIREGKQFFLRAFEGLPAETDSKVRHLVGRPYTPQTPATVEAILLDHYREAGHPFPRVAAVPRVDGEAAAAVLAIDSRPGPAARLGEVRLTGNQRTRDGFIEDRVDLEKGAEYRASDLRRAEDRLRGTGLFRQVAVAPGELREGEIPVDVIVEERDPGEVSVRGGYGTLEGARLGADLGYHNLLGGGEVLRVGGTVSRLTSRASAELAIPYFLGSELRPGVNWYLEEQTLPAFEARSFGAVPSLAIPLSATLGTTVGVRVATIRTDDVTSGVPAGDLLDFEYGAVFLAATLDERDSALLPTSGFLLGGFVEWSGKPFESDIAYFKWTARASAYVPLGGDFVFAASAQGGLIRPAEETAVIPIALRFFSGGTNSVRGFEYGRLGPEVNGKPIGGEAFYALQLELRFPLVGDLHGAVFTDRGAVWFDHEAADFDQTRYSVGAGLRYHTPAGAIVLDGAWNPSRGTGEDGGELHLSIGFPF